MKTINEDVIKANQVVLGYKELNTNTVETLKSYDPKLRIWTFKKTNIDPNAAEFKNKYCKLPKKEKKQKYYSRPKNIKVKDSKPKLITEKKPRPSGLKYNVKPRTGDTKFKGDSLIQRAYEYYLEGKAKDQICEILNRGPRAVTSMIRTRKMQLGVELVKNETHKQVIELSKKGLRVTEIANKLKLSKHNISYHIQKYYDSKTPDEIKRENEEILFHMKRISKSKGIDYCYTKWISQTHCIMEANLTTPTRNKRCKQLESEGKIIEVTEGISHHYGKMYKII